jgi:hypothetical protein
MKVIDCSFLSYNKLDLNHVIRIGSIRDGGYYVTKRLVEDSEFLISGGISYNVEFEKDFKEINPSCKIVLIDGSFNLFTYLLRPFYWFLFKKSYIKKIAGLLDMLILKSQTIFIKKFIGIEKGITLTDVFKSYIDNSNCGYLKFDIEGSEYNLLEEVLLFKNQIIGLSIEFHDVTNHIPQINTFINNLEMDMIGFNINDTGGLSDSKIPNTIELSFAKRKYTEPNNYDIASGKMFSNEFDNELLIPLKHE